jgi:hypothetical protein
VLKKLLLVVAVVVILVGLNAISPIVSNEGVLLESA